MENLMRQMEQQLDQLKSDDKNIRPFSICHKLADTTNEMIEQRDYQQLGDCMNRVLTLYSTSSSNLVRTAIENVFIYGLGNRILRSPVRAQILNMLRKRFRAILRNQIISSGI